jgi:hypothetical protein
MFEGGLYHPRLRGCLAQMALGSKMGAAIGGIFGVLMGGYQAIAQRNLLILPVAAVGGAVSFGFFSWMRYDHPLRRWHLCHDDQFWTEEDGSPHGRELGKH